MWLDQLRGVLGRAIAVACSIPVASSDAARDDEPESNFRSAGGVGLPTLGIAMAVRLHLSSGIVRLIVDADAARLDEPFFIVTRRNPLGEGEITVLTLLSSDVVAADVVKEGVKISQVCGSGRRQGR